MVQSIDFKYRTRVCEDYDSDGVGDGFKSGYRDGIRGISKALDVTRHLCRHLALFRLLFCRPNTRVCEDCDSDGDGDGFKRWYRDGIRDNSKALGVTRHLCRHVAMFRL